MKGCYNIDFVVTRFYGYFCNAQCMKSFTLVDPVDIVNFYVKILVISDFLVILNGFYPVRSS